MAIETLNVRNPETGANFVIRPRFRLDRFGDVFIGPRMVCETDDYSEEINASRFMRWLRRAKARDRLIYHYGNLTADRTFRNSSDGPLTQDASRTQGVANAAFRAFEAGLVCLVQVRVKRDPKEFPRSDYFYVAVRTDQPYEDPKDDQQTKRSNQPGHQPAGSAAAEPQREPVAA